MKSPILPSILLSLLAHTPLISAFYDYQPMQPRQAASATISSTATQTSNTPDSWECATSDIPRFFNPPKPTGTLLSGMISYGDSLIAPCTKTATGSNIWSCTVSDPKAWCAFSTVAPASLSSEYLGYRSSAASWWSASSSAAAEAKKFCPITWEKAGVIDGYWFNMTSWQAACANSVILITRSRTSAASATATPTSVSQK